MRAAKQKKGFTLLEAMILLVILSIVAVAAGVGLQSVAKIPTCIDSTLALNNEAMSRLEQLKAAGWANMTTTAATLTNTNPGIAVNGYYYPCTVTVSQANADGSGPASDYRELSVQIGTQLLTTRVMQP